MILELEILIIISSSPINLTHGQNENLDQVWFMMCFRLKAEYV